MSHRPCFLIALGTFLASCLLVGLTGRVVLAVSYVHLNGEPYLETSLPDTVTVTADCAQAGHRVTAEIFLDLNDNGLVDAGESPARFVYISDGIPTLKDEQGGEIPGDDDALVNGLLLHELDLSTEDYSFSTIPMQFVLKLTDQDHSVAWAALRLLPPAPERPYIGGLLSQIGTAAPLDSMVVVAYAAGAEDFRVTLSDQQGRYLLDVEAGEWLVTAWDLQNNYAPADSQRITVTAQDSAAIDFVLSPYPAYITGKVDSSGSQPVPGVMITAIEQSFQARCGWTAADGSYRIGVTPGIYDVYPVFLPSGYASQPPSHLNVVADSGAVVAGKNFRLGHPTSHFTGRVTYQAGGGASGVTVRAYSVAGYYYTTTTEEDGGYYLSVFPSTYMINAELAGYRVTSPVTGMYFSETVQLNQTVWGRDFVIAPLSGTTASISGAVTFGASGQPAADIYVVIFNERESSSLGWNFSRTDSTGAYQFGDIISGSWLIGVYQAGYESQPLLREATVIPGTPSIQQDFELVAATSVAAQDRSVSAQRCHLFPNRPNPFNDETLIAYTLSNDTPQPVTLRIFNVLGQEVRTLVDQTQTAGLRLVRWDGRGSEGLPVASGIYFAELRAGGQRQIQKLVFLR